MRIELPKGLVGATLGALGAASLVPVARNLGVRWIPPPRLPGAELAAGDSKAATFAEVAVFLVALPFAAYLFGGLLPRLLESYFPNGRLSFEWIPIGLALWHPLWRRGVPLRTAILASLMISVLVAVFIAAFRSSPRLRRYFAKRNRTFFLHIALAGSAWDLARRSIPLHGSLLIQDPLIEIVASGVILLALLLVFIDRSGRVCNLSARMRRLAAFAPVSVVFSALAIAFWRSAPVLLAASLVTFAMPILIKEPPLIRHGFKLATLVFAFFCGLTIYYQPFAAVDLYEDGHRLAYGQAYLNGGRPYLDTYPIHGWGYDGGADALAFRAAGATLEVFRIRLAVMTALTLTCAALACLAAFESVTWSIVAFTITLSFCPFLSERQLLVFGSLALLAWGVRSGRRVLFAMAGALAGWEVFFSLDFGVILLLGGIAGVATRPLLESGQQRLRRGLEQSALFILGVLGGALPFVLSLAQQKALTAFIRTSFLEVPSISSVVWGIPAGSLSQTLKQAKTIGEVLGTLSGSNMPSAFLLVILTIAGGTYVLGAARSRLSQADGVTWLFFAVGCTALRGVLGRADSAHFALYGLFAAVPTAWLLQRTFRSATWWPAPFLAVCLLLLVRLHPLEGIDVELGSVSDASRTRAQLASLGVPSKPGGRAGLPREQAFRLLALKTYLDEHLSAKETFFDFSGQPGLYFFTDRTMPIRFLAPPFYETDRAQREVIQVLETQRTPAAILRSGTWTDEFDNVSSRSRAPHVAEYLDMHYPKYDAVGGWTIAFRH